MKTKTKKKVTAPPPASGELNDSELAAVVGGVAGNPSVPDVIVGAGPGGPSARKNVVKRDIVVGSGPGATP
jgi:hypothetical protein